jgi:cytochrome c556
MRIAMSLIGIVALGGAVGASTEEDPAVIIEGRQANYRELGGAYKGITDELKKGKPTAMMLRHYADQLESLARAQADGDWFPSGTGREAGIDTAAKDEIWKERPEFDKWRKALVLESGKLSSQVKAGDLEALKQQHKAVGKVCAGCHKPFREKEDE